jgi:hypothetical protein
LSGYPTVDTFASLTDEVLSSLQGFTFLADQVVTLTQTITDTDTAFTVDSTSLGRGIIEIDEELIYVTSTADGVVTVPSWGRGWKGTTPAAHTSGVAVYVAPVYPRSIVTREVNNTIRAVYPDLFAVGSMDTSTNSTTYQYALPAEVDRILAVEWRWNSASGWMPVSDWEMVSGANTVDYPTGQYLSVHAYLPPAALLHVVHASAPTLMVNPTDPFAATTGLPASARDVIVFGAASRLLPWIDSGRSPAQTVSSDLTDQQRPIGLSVQLAKDLRQRYLDRLAKERDALYAQYPIRAHRIRS